jgi:hypothetical protein
VNKFRLQLLNLSAIPFLSYTLKPLEWQNDAPETPFTGYLCIFPVFSSKIGTFLLLEERKSRNCRIPNGFYANFSVFARQISKKIRPPFVWGGGNHSLEGVNPDEASNSDAPKPPLVVFYTFVG